MRYFLLSFVILKLCFCLQGQDGRVDIIKKNYFNAKDRIKYNAKPPVDTSIFGKWPSLVNPVISNDGKFFLYSINNVPIGSNTLVVQSTSGEWITKIEGTEKGTFGDNSKELIYLKKDSLFFLQLNSGERTYIPDILSFDHPKQNEKWLIYKLRKDPKKLFLKNVITKHTYGFDSVTNYRLSENGNSVLLIMENPYKEVSKLMLLELQMSVQQKIINLENGRLNFPIVRSFCFDKTGKRIAFFAKDTVGMLSIWCYNRQSNLLKMVANNQSLDVVSKTVIIEQNSSLRFSDSGEWVFFQIEDIGKSKSHADLDNMVIWRYNDKILQSFESNSSAKKKYFAAINCLSGKIIRLENEFEKVRTDLKGDIVIVNNNESYKIEPMWKDSFPQSYFLYFLSNGTKKYLTKSEFPGLSISPSNKYIIYFDTESKSYFSYEIASGNSNNISRLILFDLSTESSQNIKLNEGLEVKRRYPGIGIAGYLKDDGGILVYDDYDIWLLDFKGIKTPINLTNGFGRRNKTKLRILGNDFLHIGVFKRTDEILLVAFNEISKENGFYRTSLLKVGDPEKLIMSSCKFYNFSFFEHSLNKLINPIKARDKETWVVQRMTSEDAPNFYLTKDFKSFKVLTHFQPQQKYNWLKAELLTWKQLDGTNIQGILYKPENFDSTKKYPVIFHYYEEMSDRLFDFPIPDWTFGDLNIPWFVSNGYLVFTPDIHFIIGKPGFSAYNSVVSAAHFLSKFPYVDSSKFGLEGYSFGGFLTNYIITHTDQFAAAVSVAGNSNFVSRYGGIRKIQQGFISDQFMMETGQNRIGATLWQKPGLFLENSPILNADKVSTPLLIMHNKNDENVPWMQSVEFFTALRRLNKKVWMLQYKNEDHVLRNINNRKDFSMRLFSFFDYYINSGVEPPWISVKE